LPPLEEKARSRRWPVGRAAATHRVKRRPHRPPPIRDARRHPGTQMRRPRAGARRCTRASPVRSDRMWSLPISPAAAIIYESIHSGALNGRVDSWSACWSGARHINTDDLRITDLRLRIEHACVKRQNSGRPRGAAALRRLYPPQYPWGGSCALTVSLLLGFAEAAHDSPVRKGICHRTVVCRLRESRARARCRCTSLHFHSMDLGSHFSMIMRGSGRRAAAPPPRRPTWRIDHRTDACGRP